VKYFTTTEFKLTNLHILCYGEQTEKSYESTN